jgi:hypothetical protein
LVTSLIAAAVVVTAFAGAGVFAGVATAIAAATGGAVVAAAFAAAAFAVASVVDAPLSLLSLLSLSLLSVDDVFAGAAGAADWLWLGSAGGGTPLVAAGFARGSELFGLLAAFVFVVALLADWVLVLPLVEASVEALVEASFEVFGAALPPFAAGGLLAPRCGDAGVVLVLCVAAGVGFGLGVAGWAETWLCDGVPLADVGAGFIGAGLAFAGDSRAPWSRPARSSWHQAAPRMAESLFPAPVWVPATTATARMMALN